MKRVLFTLFAIAIVSVFALPQADAQDDATDYQAQVDLLITEVWNNGELDMIAELVAEDATIYLPPSLGVNPPFSGVEGYAMNAGGWRAGLPDLVIEPVAYIVGDGAVAIRVQITATQTEEFFGIPPTGAALDFGATLLYFFNEEGLIVEEWWEYDTVFELTQLGLFTPPGAE